MSAATSRKKRPSGTPPAPLAVVYRPLADLAPYEKNARTHSPEQIAQLAASITAFGFTNPLLLDEHNAIIAGHGRAQAAQSLGMADVPTITLAGLTAAQKRGLRIADNQLALNAGWDASLLMTELGDLKLADFDLGLLGFSGMEIDQFFAPETDVAAEWQGMPEFDQPDKMAFHTLTVHFKDQEAVDAFAKLLGQSITTTTKFTWFPRIERENFMAERYVDAA